MSVLADYTDEEQFLLMEGPRLGAVVVSAASPGRGNETVSEGFAAIQYAMNRSGEFLDNTLISSIQFAVEQLGKTDHKFADYSKLATAPGAKDAALARLSELADLLDRKSTPAEAAGYKQWVMNAATLASEAGKEGGNFFGRGAVLVNDAERAALAEIAATLRIQA
jgi:hypothetical protein